MTASRRTMANPRARMTNPRARMTNPRMRAVLRANGAGDLAVLDAWGRQLAAQAASEARRTESARRRALAALRAVGDVCGDCEGGGWRTVDTGGVTYAIACHCGAVP